MLLKNSLFGFSLLFTIVVIAQPPSAEQMEKAREHFNKGVQHGINYAYQDAVDEFNKAIELNALFAEAFLYKGLAEIELGDYTQALKDLTITIELDPAHSDQAHYFRGLTKYHMEDFTGAIDDLTIAIKMNPDFVAFYQRGKANLKLGEYRRSLQDFEISLRLQPDFYEAYLYRGINLYYLDKFDDSIEDLEIAKKNLPGNAMAFYYSGLARNRVRNSYVAIEDLNRAIELDPNYSSAYEARAKAQANTGNQASAQRDQEIAQKLLTESKPVARESAGNTVQQESISPVVVKGAEGVRPASTSDINFADLFSSQNRVDEQSSGQDAPLNNTTTETSSPQLHVFTGSEMVTSSAPFSINDAPSGIYSLSLEKTKPAGFGVQVASYTNTENLISLAKAYEEKYSVPVVISVANLNNRKVYRLIISQHNTRVSAEQFRDKLRTDGFPDAYLVLFENL
jgi:tetratricopeptide (TPR) repeat protein